MKCSALYKKEIYKGKNNPFYGKKHTTQTKEKIRVKAIGRKIGKAWNSGLSKYKKKSLPRVTINGKRMLKSHYIWSINNKNKKIPKGHIIHHKDGNPYNNSIFNLKLMKDIKHRKLHIRLMKEILNKK